MKNIKKFIIIAVLMLSLAACRRLSKNQSVESQSLAISQHEIVAYGETYERETQSSEEVSDKENVEESKAVEDSRETAVGVSEKTNEKISDQNVKKALLRWNPKGFNNYYLKPESSKELLTEEDLQCFNKTELRLIRNEIAARYGWEFEDPELKSYFITQEWYEAKEGCNNQVQFNDIEVKNVSLIEKMENREEQAVDYHRLEQLTELKPGDTYEFCFNKTKITLETTDADENNHKIMTLYENGEVIISHEYIDENDKILVYNKKSESYLIVSRGFFDNDYIWSPLYLLNDDGVTFLEWIGGTVCSYTENAFCNYDEGIAIGHYLAYEWLFLQGDEFVPMGKAITNKYSYTAKKEFVGYSFENAVLIKKTISQGDTLTLERIDNRDKDVCWIELKRNEQMVLLPYFRDDDGFLDKCEDGAQPWEYFDVREPAG